jgi:hypothetical protein
MALHHHTTIPLGFHLPAVRFAIAETMGTEPAAITAEAVARSWQ